MLRLCDLARLERSISAVLRLPQPTIRYVAVSQMTLAREHNRIVTELRSDSIYCDSVTFAGGVSAR